MSWDAKNVALLKKLWAVGQSAAQIARRVGCSRNAVCGRLTRLDLKRGHKQKNPRLISKRRPALLAAPAGEEGVPEDGWETTQEIQQARALRYAG